MTRKVYVTSTTVCSPEEESHWPEDGVHVALSSYHSSTHGTAVRLCSRQFVLMTCTCAFTCCCRYATVFSAAIWEKLFSADPFDRKAGDLVHREIFAKGGATDPVHMLKQVLGDRPVTVEPLIRELAARFK